MKQIVFYFLLFYVQVFSQNYGKAIYSVKMDDSFEIDENILKEYLYRAKQSSDDVKFVLDFNNNETLFYHDFLEKDGTDVKFVLMFCGYTTQIYSDLKEKQCYYNNSETIFLKKNQYLIKKPTLNNWEITNERKVIGDLNCYKAICDYEIFNSRGKFTHKAVAWYCPDIPVQGGPKEFGNLPGLIVELHNKNVTFGLEKINFYKQNEIFVTKPSEGIKIDFYSFNELVKEKLKTLKEEVKK